MSEARDGFEACARGRSFGKRAPQYQSNWEAIVALLRERGGVELDANTTTPTYGGRVVKPKTEETRGRARSSDFTDPIKEALARAARTREAMDAREAMEHAAREAGATNADIAATQSRDAAAASI